MKHLIKGYKLKGERKFRVSNCSIKSDKEGLVYASRLHQGLLFYLLVPDMLLFRICDPSSARSSSIPYRLWLS